MFRARHLLPAVPIALALLAAVWLAVHVIRPPAEPEFATVLPEPKPLPAFSLVDHEGRPFTRERLEGRTSLVFFGFTHCPDICPLTLGQLASARRELAAGAPEGSPLPQIVFVSVDPERDTPSKVAAYVQHFGQDIVGVTGPVDDLRTLTEPLGIFFEKRGTGDDYAVSHSTAVLVVGPNAALEALFSTPHRVESFVHDVPLLMASR